MTAATPLSTPLMFTSTIWFHSSFLSAETLNGVVSQAGQSEHMVSYGGERVAAVALPVERWLR